jgi:hypothetical protein
MIKLGFKVYLARNSGIGRRFNVVVGKWIQLLEIQTEFRHQDGGLGLNGSRIRNGQNPGESSKVALKPS